MSPRRGQLTGFISGASSRNRNSYFMAGTGLPKTAISLGTVESYEEYSDEADLQPFRRL